MSASFRPVIEKWGEHSSNFVDSDILCNVILQLADNEGSESVYDDKFSVWIQDGAALLDKLHDMDTLARTRLAGELADEYGASLENMKNLLGNMHSLSVEWRKMLDTDGSIRFYID